MPATGRWIANKLGVKGFTTSMLGDPATNVSFGTFYLKTVLDEFDGSLALAAAAYNAGPSRSRTWRASLKQPVEAAIFAESIPFTETRDYVKKVLSNATIYGQALNPAGPHTHLKTRLGQVVPKASTVTSDTP
jgi:soluble lytic murein transglycosylase